jgi:hypothetical protein
VAASEVSQVYPVVFFGQPTTAFLVHLVVTIFLRVFVDVVPRHEAPRFQNTTDTSSQITNDVPQNRATSPLFAQQKQFSGTDAIVGHATTKPDKTAEFCG